MNRRYFRVIMTAAGCCLALAAQSLAQEADLQAQDTTQSTAGVFYRPADSYEKFVARYRRDTVARFGWWGVSTSGDPEQVGEWDSLKSSPFWDVDGLRSDGNQTLDFSLNGTEQEANHANAYYYRPGLRVTVDYDRFLHRTDNEPTDNFNLVIPGFSLAPGHYKENATWTPAGGDDFTKTSAGPATVSRQIIGQDLNIDDDAAIRVQELKLGFKGDVTDNVQWRLNLWGMHKEGERQVFGTGHCFNGTLAAPGEPTENLASGARACHSLSRLQRIEWTTMEIEPMLIADWSPVTVTYSHRLKTLNQNDDILFRNYTTSTPQRTIGSTAGGTANFWDYALVPENVTDIDRVRIGWDVSEYNKVYANLFIGNTHNKYRGTDRQYSGWDVRLTNDAIENVTLTGYARQYTEENDDIPAPRAVPSWVVAANPHLADPVNSLTAGTGSDEIAPAGALPRRTTDWRVDRWDYDRRSAGVDGRWRPFGGGGDLQGLSLTGGYDHTDFLRRNAVVPTEEYDINVPGAEPVEIGSTIYDTLSTGAQMRWSSSFDNFVRYKRIWIRNPLFAVHWPNEAENTGLPTNVDIVEFGGTWFPADNFMTTATIGLENRSNQSHQANFAESSYPITVSSWYAPTNRLSLNGGLGFYSNSIDQNISFGDQIGGYQGPPNPSRFFLFPVTERVNYNGRASVVTVGTNYAWTERVSLMGSFEFVRGENGFDSLPLWPEMNTLSDVIIETTRFTAGVDWMLRERVSVYCRYLYYDWGDKSQPIDSGTSHMVLGGMSASF